MSFYAIFYKLCETKEISPARVRADLGISQSTMASWKSRNLTPKPATVQRLADYFGVSVDFLLGVKTEYAIKPELNVGDTYFNGAVRVTRSDWESSPASLVFEIDEDRMPADELVALMGIIEKMSRHSGVSTGQPHLKFRKKDVQEAIGIEGSGKAFFLDTDSATEVSVFAKRQSGFA